jgi:very-short-patch-repair endonuclease
MQGQTNKSIKEHKLHRLLRNTMTDAEIKLWSVLRGRQLDGCKFRRQHPFDRYILDFICLEKKLVVEVDGGQHLEHALQDAERTAYLEKAGFRIIRFWNHEVLTQIDAVKERLWQVLHEDVAPSPPRPSP